MTEVSETDAGFMSRAAGVFGYSRRALDLVWTTSPGLTLTLDYTHFTRLGLPDADVEPLLKVASHFHVRGAPESCRPLLPTLAS